MPVSQINKTITPYSGDPPAIGQDQQTFSANAFRKAMHDPVVVEDINQVIGQINAVASEMNAAITEAVTKANEADQSANDAEASKLHARDYANEAAQIKADTQTLKEQANQARLDAEAALDAFDDKYLGSKTSDPTLDNDGESLQEGAFYDNSTTGKIRVFTNGGWVQGIASVAGVESINAIQGAINLKSINGVSLLGEGDIQTATLDGEESLTNKTIVDPILALSGTNGLAGQVPVSQGEGLPPVWGNLPAGSEIVRVARTSNTALDASNRGNLIDITSGTFTQTFDSATNIGNGWYCYIENSGTGNITLDPNSGETIDGLNSFIMYPGEIRLIQCDGYNFLSIVVKSFYSVFTESGVFIKPPGYTMFEGLLWAGGGAGKRVDDGYAFGGGGGACNHFTLPFNYIGNSANVIIGAGGLAVNQTGIDGGVGGTSSFNSTVFAYGGNSNYHGAGGGVISDNEGNRSPYNSGNDRSTDFGGAGSGYSSYYGGAGASTLSQTNAPKSVYGGAGGGGRTPNGHFPPGTSVFGGNGGAYQINGVAPGGGGGGSYYSSPGSGARGELRIWGII